MLAFEDDSHFERERGVAILRSSRKGWPLIVGGETAFAGMHLKEYYCSFIISSHVPVAESI